MSNHSNLYGTGFLRRHGDMLIVACAIAIGDSVEDAAIPTECVVELEGLAKSAAQIDLASAMMGGAYLSPARITLTLATGNPHDVAKVAEGMDISQVLTSEIMALPLKTGGDQ